MTRDLKQLDAELRADHDTLDRDLDDASWFLRWLFIPGVALVAFVALLGGFLVTAAVTVVILTVTAWVNVVVSDRWRAWAKRWADLQGDTTELLEAIAAEFQAYKARQQAGKEPWQS